MDWLMTQCDREDGTCKEMEDEIEWLERVSPENATKFKCTSFPHVFDWSSLQMHWMQMGMDGHPDFTGY